MSKCHCLEPATWMVRVVPVTYHPGHEHDGRVLAENAADSWAACDEHVGEAAAGLIRRNEMDEKILVLRRENIE